MGFARFECQGNDASGGRRSCQVSRAEVFAEHQVPFKHCELHAQNSEIDQEALVTSRAESSSRSVAALRRKIPSPYY
jgi:hypothetical protein